jgi:hypothetical protein
MTTYSLFDVDKILYGDVSPSDNILFSVSTLSDVISLIAAKNSDRTYDYLLKRLIKQVDVLREIEFLFSKLVERKADFYSHETSVLDALINFSFINFSGCLDFFPRTQGMRRPLFSEQFKLTYPETFTLISHHEAWWIEVETLRHEAAHGSISNIPPIIRGEENTAKYNELCQKPLSIVLEHGKKRLAKPRQLSPSLEDIMRDVSEIDEVGKLAQSYQDEANSLLECQDIFSCGDKIYPLTPTLREWTERICNIITIMATASFIPSTK